MFPQYLNIKNYHVHLAKNKNGCLDAVNYYLQKIEENNHLNAFVEVYATESIERAKALDIKRNNGEAIGKLHGVIIAIKDVICYKGHKVSAASAILKDFTSIYNSTAVERLLKEDAIIIGNCNCDEFAMGSSNENSVHGKVLNAIDETKVSGGSSGGSAVAVQADMCMVSLGSDTGGSVRQPADFCGIIGLKPSYGKISRHGLIAYASSFDQIGIFAKNIDDVATVLEVIQGPDEFDSTVSINASEKYFANAESEQKYRFAYLKNALEHPSLDKEIKLKIEHLIQKLKNDGHTVEAIDFELIDHVVPTYYILTTAEASSNLSRYDGVRYGYRNTDAKNDLTEMYTKSRSEAFGKEVKRRIMLGTFVLTEGYYEAYYSKAQQVRKLLVHQTENLFKNFDAILIPTVPGTAFSIDSMEKDPVAVYLADIYTVFANLTGIPAISLPLFKHNNNMPFGVQVMANKYNEVTLLHISKSLLKEYKAY